MLLRAAVHAANLGAAVVPLLVIVWEPLEARVRLGLRAKKNGGAGAGLVAALLRWPLRASCAALWPPRESSAA